MRSVELEWQQRLSFATFALRGFGSIRSFGGSPSLVLRPARGLQLGGTFNYSHTRRDGKPLAVMPPMFGNARVSWQPVPDGVTYNVTSGTAQSLVLTPVVSRLYGFVGLYYDFESKKAK